MTVQPICASLLLLATAGALAAQRDAVIARELEALRGPKTEGLIDPAESERGAREAPFADSLAAYEALIVGNDNTLWVVDALSPGEGGWTATAFRRDGAILGRLSGTGQGRPLAFSADRVAVRLADADGVVSIGIYRFTRPAVR